MQFIYIISHAAHHFFCRYKDNKEFCFSCTKLCLVCSSFFGCCTRQILLSVRSSAPSSGSVFNRTNIHNHTQYGSRWAIWRLVPVTSLNKIFLLMSFSMDNWNYCSNKTTLNQLVELKKSCFCIRREQSRYIQLCTTLHNTSEVCVCFCTLVSLLFGLNNQFIKFHGNLNIWAWPKIHGLSGVQHCSRWANSAKGRANSKKCIHPTTTTLSPGTFKEDGGLEDGMVLSQIRRPAPCVPSVPLVFIYLHSSMRDVRGRSLRTRRAHALFHFHHTQYILY